jgi:GH35 family endo-1,4-beta-xylanase
MNKMNTSDWICSVASQLRCRLSLAVPTLLVAVVAHVSFAAAPQSYENKWHADALTKRIDRNIETYRKGDGTLEVVDASGKPVSGARVEIQQTGHEFLFGCNSFVLGQLKTAELNEQYEQAFAKLFNFTTVGFYWEATEPRLGELRYETNSRPIWRRPPPDAILPFAAKYGITLKGHPLLWHGCNPTWLPKNPAELKELYRQRFREIASRYGDKIPMWEVVNESQVCPPSFPLYTTDRAYVGWAFDEAAALFPKKDMLMINDVTPFAYTPAAENKFIPQIKKLLAEGKRMQGIGLQYHFFHRAELDPYLKVADPVKLLDLYDEFGKIGLPLYITEITFGSAGEGGEDLQAEVVRDHYRLWFSAPKMAGITWWNLGDGAAYQGENDAKGGLMDSNLQPKAAYRVLDQLINHEWTTSTQAQTDVQGVAHFRGFYGKYQVTVIQNGKSSQFEVNHSQSGPATHRLTLKD